MSTDFVARIFNQPEPTVTGAGSVLQHVVANGGQTQPPLFRAAMTSSTFLPSQYNYNDPIPTVRYRMLMLNMDHNLIDFQSGTL